MKTFKQFDFWVSVVLILVFAIVSIIRQDETVILGYVVIGSWQVLSMLVHLFTKTFTHYPGARFTYNWVTLIAVVTIPVGSVWVLVFTAPFMALYYTWLCYNEVFVKMQRPLSVLK